MSKFTKMHGAGNDFIVMDGRTESFDVGNRAYWEALSDRRMGIGCEGFLLLFASDDPTVAFRLIFLNPDGREAELCGNGTRCAALYGHCHGFTREKSFVIATGAGRVEAEVLRDDPKDGFVRIRLQPASSPEVKKVPLGDGSMVECVCVNSGVPHAVVFVEDVEAVDVCAVGRALRYHEAFAPAGTNVDFVQRMGPHSLRMRTYERGVEAESGACGTGAVAAAVACRAQCPEMVFPVEILVSSGATLVVDPCEEEGKGPLLTGPACEVFWGRV